MRLTGSVKLRPVRLGFLLPPGNLALVCRVVRLCNCLWGGRYNPIIPYLEGAPQRWIEPYRRAQGLDVTRGYVDFFEPDVIVEASAGMAAEIGWSEGKGRFDLPRILALDRFYEVDYRGHIEFAAGVDVVNVMQHLYDREYKYQRRHKAPFVLVDDADDSAFFDVFPGAYPKDEELTYISDAYRDIFEPEVLPNGATASIRIIKEQFVGPIWISRYGLEESLGRRRSDNAIFVFDPTDPADVIDYWNYRLIERHVLPISIRWLAEHAALLREQIVEVHRPIPGNPFGTMFHTDIYFARSIEDQALKDVVQKHFSGLPDRSFWVRRSPSIWPSMRSGNRWREAKILVKAASAPFDEEVSATGYVKVPAPAPEFHNAAGTYTRSSWMNVVSPTSSHRGDELAIVYPSNLWNPNYPRLATHEMSVTREGWTIASQHSIGYSLISPVGRREALIGWFKVNGVEAYSSEEGQVAAQIIAAAGSLLACGMFADAETLSLLNGMAESHAERTRHGEPVRTTNPDRAKHANRIRQHFDQRSKRSFGYWNKLDYFLERSVFRAGLRVQCPTCAHYNWFDLDRIGYAPSCSRCLKQFRFDQTPAALTKTQWFYRIIGPFAAPDYARGGYAVALTLRCIAESHQTEMTWSTGLVLSNLNCEIDFAAWYRRSSILDEERDEPVLVIGEAKSFGRDAIDDKALSGLRRAAERFPGAMLVVSSLRPIKDYSVAEIERLSELAKWIRSRVIDGNSSGALIVLTATELFSEYGITQAWKAVGGRAAKLAELLSVDLTDLYRLAEATQQLYLNLPPFSADYENNAKLRWQRGRLLNLIKRRATSIE